MSCFLSPANSILVWNDQCRIIPFILLHALLHVASVDTAASFLSAPGTISSLLSVRNLVVMISGHITLPLCWQVLCTCRLFYLTSNALRLMHNCCPHHGWKHWAKNVFRVSKAWLGFSQPLSSSPFLLATFPSVLNRLFPWHEMLLLSDWGLERPNGWLHQVCKWNVKENSK